MEMFALIYIDTCTLNVVFASDGLIVSHFSGETMKVDRLLKFMASMVCYINFTVNSMCQPLGTFKERHWPYRDSERKHKGLTKRTHTTVRKEYGRYHRPQWCGQPILGLAMIISVKKH